MPSRPGRSLSAAALLLALLAVAGCSASRYPGPGRSIESCDYCVLNEEQTYGYFDEANRILGQSFIMLRDDDPRLQLPSVRDTACATTIDWSRGFWSTTAWVDVKDYESGADILQSYIRRGFLYMGAHSDVMELLKDVAAARAVGPPLPDPAEVPVGYGATGTPGAAPGGPSSVESRLIELERIYDRGLISQREYQERRQAILGQL